MRAIVAGSLFVVCWSSGFVGAVLAEPAGSPAAVLAWRYSVTAALLVAVVLLRPDSRAGLARSTPRDLWQQAVSGVLAHVVFLGGVFAAADRGLDAGTTALVCALQPMVVTAAGRVWWGDLVRRRQLFGLVLGLVAVAVTVGGGAAATSALLALPAAALLGLSGATLLERRRPSALDVPTGLCVQVVVAGAVFAVVASWSGRLGLAPSLGSVLALGWLVLLSGLGGYACFVLCLRTVGSTGTSLLLYLTPAVTTLWAWVMLAQAPSTDQWVGLGLGAVAVGLAWPRPRAAPGGPPRPARGGRPRAATTSA